jgi:Ca2+-binding EF-hand superfamily protein
MSRLSPAERQKCAAIFNQLDYDGSGTVDATEIHAAMSAMGALALTAAGKNRGCHLQPCIRGTQTVKM